MCLDLGSFLKDCIRKSPNFEKKFNFCAHMFFNVACVMCHEFPLFQWFNIDFVKEMVGFSKKSSIFVHNAFHMWSPVMCHDLDQKV